MKCSSSYCYFLWFLPEYDMNKGWLKTDWNLLPLKIIRRAEKSLTLETRVYHHANLNKKEDWVTNNLKDMPGTIVVQNFIYKKLYLKENLLPLMACRFSPLTWKVQTKFDSLQMNLQDLWKRDVSTTRENVTLFDLIRTQCCWGRDNNTPMWKSNFLMKRVWGVFNVLSLQ